MDATVTTPLPYSISRPFQDGPNLYSGVPVLNDFLGYQRMQDGFDNRKTLPIPNVRHKIPLAE